jgi:hypothetical protein
MLDSTKWPDSTAGVVWDAAGRVKLPCTSSYERIATSISLGNFFLTGSGIQAQITPPSFGNGGREIWLEVSRVGVVNQDKLSMCYSGGYLVARQTVGGSTQSQTTAYYAAGTHAFWRIREQGGTVYFETSPDGSTWNPFWSVAPAFAITNVWASVRCGYFGTESADNGYVDNINFIAPYTTAKIETLTDAFDTTVDFSKWNWSSGSVVWDSGAGGRAKIPCATSYYSLATAMTGPWYDLTGSAVFAKMTPPPNGAGSREFYIEALRATVNTDKVSFFWASGNLYWRLTRGGVQISQSSIPYDAVNHAWLRIRESGGTVYFDTSPDGAVWTNRASLVPGFDVSKIWVNFSAGYWSTESASDAYVDSVNIAPYTGVTYTKAGSGILESNASGTRVKVWSKTGSGISAHAANGSDASTFVDSGVGVSENTGSGFEAKSHAVVLAGSGIKTHAASGLDAITFGKTGSGVKDSFANGVRAREYAKTGNGVSSRVGSGQDAFLPMETGLTVRVETANGSKAITFAKAGAGISARVSSGADIYIFGKTGAGISGRIGGGMYVRAGGAQKLGSGIRENSASGFDATIYSKSGSGIRASAAGGIRNYALGKTGVGISILAASGSKAPVFAKTGVGISARISSGNKNYVAGKTGAGISERAASGSKLLMFGKTGTGISSRVGSGATVKSVIWFKAGAGIRVQSASGVWDKDVLKAGGAERVQSASGTRIREIQKAGIVVMLHSAGGFTVTQFGKSGTGIRDSASGGESKFVAGITFTDEIWLLRAGESDAILEAITTGSKPELESVYEVLTDDEMIEAVRTAPAELVEVGQGKAELERVG